MEDYIASITTVATRRDNVRRQAGISMAGLTQFPSRALKGLTNVCPLNQVAYGYMHCTAQGIFQEIEGTVCKILQGLQYDARFHTKCDLDFINDNLENIKWSHVDANESITPIQDDMILDPAKKGNPAGRATLRSRNAQQTVLYMSLLSASLNHYCDSILPSIIHAHPELEGSPIVGCVLSSRELLAKVTV
jgi:hypothetical protein